MCYFTEGTKPALLVKAKMPRNIDGEIVYRDATRQTKLKEKGYPYIYFELSNGVLFFQNEQLLKEFTMQGGYLRRYSDKRNRWVNIFRHDKLGIALGMPPSAVDFFKNINNYTKKEKIFFRMGELEFVTHATLLEETVKWLRETYKVNYPIVVRTYDNKKVIYN